MYLVKPSIEMLWITPDPLETIEKAGRTCYKSEDKITDKSAEIFVSTLLQRGHHAMIEHASASYRVICDRGVTHEIVRHRLFSYAQESTRYCDYAGGVTFIIPPWTPDIIPGECCFSKTTSGIELIYTQTLPELTPSSLCLLHFLKGLEEKYQWLREQYSWTPQQARAVLPNCLKTEIVITGNLREWMHFFKLRTATAAHPQMQEVANMLLADIRTRIPVIFD